MSDLKYGDVRDDGYIFKCRLRDRGAPREKWMSPKASLKDRMGKTLSACRRRATEKNIDFNLDIDFLLSIYPKDNLCPVFGIEMSFGSMERGKTGPTDNSPSLDRIIPALGYTKGNVIFVSNKANTIKSYATPEEIIRVGEFYLDLQNSE